MDIGNMHKNGKDHECGSGDILAGRQTDTHTDILITILRNRSRGRSNHTAAIYRHTTSSCTESKVTNDDAQK